MLNPNVNVKTVYTTLFKELKKKTFLASKDEIIADAASICIEHHSEATVIYRDLGLTLVLVWNSEMLEEFDFCFSKVFC